MRETALDLHDDGLFLLVADDDALENALRHILEPVFSPCVEPTSRFAALAADRLDPRDVAADTAHPRGVFELPGGALKAQVELLLLEVQELLLELIARTSP